MTDESHVQEHIGIALVDDHPLVRNGVKSLLRNASDIVVVGEASSLDSAARMVQAKQPDVLVLDVQLGEKSGLELLPKLSTLSPHTRVLVLSSFLNPAIVGTCERYGVAGYLIKDTEDLDIASAVRVIACGGNVFDPRVVGLERQGIGVRPQDDLSPREYQVLGYVCQGLTNAEIAGELRVSENTIKGYVSSVMRKFACDNRVKLVLKAKELGLA